MDTSCVTNAIEDKRASQHDWRRYQAYGLILRSETAIPGMENASSASDHDVSIYLRDACPSEPGATTLPQFKFEKDHQRFYWPQIGALTIRSPSVIDLEPALHEFSAMLHLPLLGAVFATLLHRRGYLVLHASSVEINGQAIALLGDKGAGKSTTCAALLDAGHKLVADDIVAIRDEDERGPLVYPGLAEMRLDDNAVRAGLLSAAPTAPSPHAAFPKTLKRVDDRFGDTPTPITKAYVLRPGPESAVTPTSATEAFQHLLRFSYVSRFGAGALGALDSARHLTQCARASHTLNVSVLTVPHGYDRLHETVSAIERDIRC